MAQSHVVSGLAEKRGELAGQAEHLGRELQRLTQELGHLDAAIRLFDPEYPIGRVRARRPPRRRRFGQGECQRLILETLRDAPGPLSERALAQALARRKGLDTGPAALAELHKTAQGVLRRLAAKGVARAVAAADGARAWERT
jgi:hypothetical protein